MCKKSNLFPENAELTDDQLEQAMGGFDFEGDPLPDASLRQMQQCSKGHFFDMWLTECPICSSNVNTTVENTNQTTSANQITSVKQTTESGYSELLRPIDTTR